MSFQSLTMPCSMGYRMDSSPRCSWGQRAGLTAAASLSAELASEPCCLELGVPTPQSSPRAKGRYPFNLQISNRTAAECSHCPISGQSRGLLHFHGPLGVLRASDRRHPLHCLIPGHNLLAPRLWVSALGARLATMILFYCF